MASATFPKGTRGRMSFLDKKLFLFGTSSSVNNGGLVPNNEGLSIQPLGMQLP